MVLLWIKLDNYIRMSGALSYGDGGEPYDVINIMQI